MGVSQASLRTRTRPVTAEWAGNGDRMLQGLRMTTGTSSSSEREPCTVREALWLLHRE